MHPRQPHTRPSARLHTHPSVITPTWHAGRQEAVAGAAPPHQQILNLQRSQGGVHCRVAVHAGGASESDRLVNAWRHVRVLPRPVSNKRWKCERAGTKRKPPPSNCPIATEKHALLKSRLHFSRLKPPFQPALSRYQHAPVMPGAPYVNRHVPPAARTTISATSPSTFTNSAPALGRELQKGEPSVVVVVVGGLAGGAEGEAAAAGGVAGCRSS